MKIENRDQKLEPLGVPAVADFPQGHQLIATECEEVVPDDAGRALGTIMLVDDEALCIEILQELLAGVGYRNFVSTTQPREAFDLLYTTRPDVLFLDVMMGDVSGFEILKQIRRDPALRHMPVIMLTAATDADIRLTALRLGATDFLAKPVDPSELVLRLRNTLAAKAHLDRVAHSDALTGLPNRERFTDRLDWSIRMARRYGTDGAILQIGLDRFKQINEALGPGLGDRLLRAVAQRLVETVRDTDAVVASADEPTEPFLSRVGGDEFSVLLARVSRPDGPAAVAQRVLNALAAPFDIAGRELFVTCCVGIAVFPSDGTTRDTILRAAAVAMRRAKAQRRESFRFYSKDMDEKSLLRLGLESELRRAIDREELELHYQPKVELKHHRVVGAEALVRWRHPERGLISPGEFIPLAEECGLIIPLGLLVLRLACRQLSAWRERGFVAPRISVNISSHQFRHRDLLRQIQSALSEHGIPASSLCVEVTESAIMEHARESAATLGGLQQSGIAISMDDFGTGYSSLSYLKRFLLDEIKIDRSFIADIERDEDSAAIVTAVLAMAHRLGLRVVAEGVETGGQLAFLAAHGCEECQGFLFSRPLPEVEFTKLLRADGLPTLTSPAPS